MAQPNVLLLSVLLVAIISVVALAQDCTYTIKVRTGTRDSAGTDAVIGVELADKAGHYIDIRDLATWGGKMGDGHNYFQNGNLDIFSGTEKCLPSPVCFMTLKSDNSGGKPGWYVIYVDVTTTKPGSPSQHHNFGVEQWLATDESPHELTTERNHCPATVRSDMRKSHHINRMN